MPLHQLPGGPGAFACPVSSPAASAHIEAMNKNLSAIRKLAEHARNRSWRVEAGHEYDPSKRFYTIPWVIQVKDGLSNLDFGKDAETAYLVAAAVQTAAPMAAALQQLDDLAAGVPADAPENVKLFARAIQNAVASVPDVVAMPSKDPQGE